MEKSTNDLNILAIDEFGKSNIYSVDLIMNNLKDKSVNLIAVDRLSSTNTVLKSIYNIVSENTVLLADSQTAGRGRLNK